MTWLRELAFVSLLASFFALLLGMASLIARLSVVGKLGRLYPDRTGRKVSMKLGYLTTDFSYIWVWMAAGEEGFYLGRWLTPRAFIPWSQVSECEKEDGLVFYRCRVNVAGTDSVLRVYGARAKELLADYQAAVCRRS